VFSKSGHQFKALRLLDLRLTFSSLSDFRSGLRFGTSFLFAWLFLLLNAPILQNSIGKDFELIFPEFFLNKLTKIERISEL
jgi:hypothetical protein